MTSCKGHHVVQDDSQLEHSAIMYTALPCLAVDFCPSLIVYIYIYICSLAIYYNYAGIHNMWYKVGNEKS